METPEEKWKRLEEEVLEGKWRTDPALLERIYDEVADLIIEYGGTVVADFGTPDFWDHVVNGFKKDKHYEIQGPANTFIKKYGVSGHEYTIHWDRIENSADLEATVEAALGETINDAFAGGEGHPQDRVQVEINHPALETPINIGKKPAPRRRVVMQFFFQGSPIKKNSRPRRSCGPSRR